MADNKGEIIILKLQIVGKGKRTNKCFFEGVITPKHADSTSVTPQKSELPK